MRLPNNRTFSITDSIDGRTLAILARTSDLRSARRLAQEKARECGCGVSLICQTTTDRVLVDQFYPAN